MGIETRSHIAMNDNWHRNSTHCPNYTINACTSISRWNKNLNWFYSMEKNYILSKLLIIKLSKTISENLYYDPIKFNT